MVKSILDNDLYKFTMQQAVWHHFPKTQVKSKFYDRDNNIVCDDLFISELQSAVSEMKDLCLSPNEFDYMLKLGHFSIYYMNYLNNYRFNPDQVHIFRTNGKLQIEIDGLWVENILWESPVLALVSELYLKRYKVTESSLELCEKVLDKVHNFDKIGAKFVEMGTRRRQSFRYHVFILNLLRLSENCIGTSNVFLAKKFGIAPIGTMAHEWIMAHSVLGSLEHANFYAMKNWVEVYGNKLSIGLTDTYGTDGFLEDFSEEYTESFDGVRHDSDDPFEFISKLIKHYKLKNVIYNNKTFIFSNGLDNFKDVVDIQAVCDEVGVKCVFGIGTWLTNDFKGIRPLNIVIKLDEVNGYKVVKLSDSPGKRTGDAEAVRIAVSAYALKGLC